MNNDGKKYTSISSQHGKSDLYNIVKLEVKRFDKDTAPHIKSEFIEFYGRTINTLKGTKNALEMSQVEYMDSSGLAAMLVFNRLSMNNKYGFITLINCQPQVERLMYVSMLDTVVKMTDNIKEI